MAVSELSASAQASRKRIQGSIPARAAIRRGRRPCSWQAISWAVECLGPVEVTNPRSGIAVSGSRFVLLR